MKKSTYLLTLLLTALFCLPWTSTAWADELTVADGTAVGTTATTNKYAPIYGYYCDGLLDHMQMIYPASMISDLAKGPITDITFYSTTATQSWGAARFNVKLAVVNESTLSAINTTAAFTTVASNVDLSITNNKFTIHLAGEGYEYTGSKNLLVDIELVTKGSGSSSTAPMYEGITATSGTSYTSFRYSSYASVSNQSSAFLPKATFTYEDNTAACKAPKNIQITDLNSSSVSFSWDKGGSETSWQYLYLPATTDLTDSHWNGATSTTSQSATISGLSGLTSYVFYVRSDCDEDGYSKKVSKAFDTPCAGEPLPWEENFDAMSTGTYSSSAPECWNMLNANNGGYPYIYVSTTYAKAGKGLYFTSSKNKYGYIILPPFAAATNVLKASFWYKHEGTSTSNGIISIGYMTDVNDEETFTPVEVCSRTTTYTKKVNILFTSAPSSARIAFRYGGGTGDCFYAGIDSIKIESTQDCSKPATPTYEDLTGSSVTINWTANAGVEDYKYLNIDRTANPDAVLDWASATDVTGTSVPLSELIDGHTYNFYVMCACGDTPSDPCVYTPLSCPVVTGVTLSNQLYNAVTVNWTTSATTNCDVEYKAGSGEWQTAETNTSATSKVISGLSVGTEYSFRVKPNCSADGWVAAGESYTPTCPALGALTLSNQTYNGVTVSWSAVAGISTWNLKYRKGSDSWTEVNNIAALTYTIESGLATNEEYTIELYSECGGSAATITYTPEYAAPTSVLVSAKDLGGDASWAPVDGATGYEYIVVDKDAAEDWTSPASGTTVVSSYVHANPELIVAHANTDYDFYVRAVFAGGTSPATKKSFTTTTHTPSSLALSTKDDVSATFTWADNTNGAATRYQWACKASGTPTDGEYILLEDGVKTITVTGLTASTNYTFYVRSYYEDGIYSSAVTNAFKTDCGIVGIGWSEHFNESTIPSCWSVSNGNSSYSAWEKYNYTDEGYSSSYSIRYKGRSGYTAATLQTPSMYLTEKAVIKVYWKNSNGLSVDVKVSADGGTTKTSIEHPLSTTQSSLTQKTIDLSAYEGETIILYFNATGNSSTTRYIYMDELTLEYAPISAPTGLTATPTPDGATITWSHDEDGPFDLQYREYKDEEPYEEWKTESVNAKEKLLSDLTAGTTYEVQVRAHCSENRISGYTTPITFSPECAAPVSITKTAETYNSVSLSWTGAAKALRYKTGSEDWTKVNFDPAKSVHTIENLTPGSAYTVQVQAECDDADEKWSEAFAFTPNYVAPSGVTVDNITATSAEVAWTANSGEASWTLQYKTGSADWTTVPVTENPYTLTGLSSATNYQVQVAAGIFYSGTASFLTECGTLTPLGYTEDFEDMETGSYADDKLLCWETLNAVHTGVSNPPYVYVGTEAKNSSKGMTFRGSPSTYIYAILPEFSGSYEGLQLAFSHKEENASNSGKVILGYMTNIAQANSFEPLMSEITYTRSTSWKDTLVSLNSVPVGARLAFRYGGGSINWDAYVDNIAITAIPSCAIPTDLDATSISTSGATLSWTSDADKWDIQYSTNSDFSSYSSVSGVTDKPYNLTGLSANTLYYVRVKADCGSGNKSEWSTATSFRTECEVKTVDEGSPWTENFTSGHSVGEAPYCWETIPSVNNSSVSTTVTADGDLDIYQHYTNTEIAILPVFSTDIKNLRISFNYKNSNANSNYASLEVGYVIGDTFHPVQTLAKTESYTSASDIEMPADVITTARIAFRLTNTKNYDSHAYVDNIEVALKETCKTPVNVQQTVLTDEGATFTWEASDLDETQYQYACVDADAVLTDEDWVLLADGLNTVTITGKTVGNNYDFYVRSYCEVDKQSRPTEKVTFSPVCAGLATPSVSAVTNNSATITWVGNAKSLQYRIYKSEEPFNSWTTETIPTADKAAPFVLSGLDAATQYEVRVQSFCATTDDELWSGVVSFTTWCGLKDAAELPLNENFDDKSALPDCWEKISASEYPQVTSNLLWFQGTDEQIVVLPSFDIALDKLSLSFTYSANNASIELGYLVEANGTFNSLGAVTSGEEIDLSTTSAPASAGYLAIHYYNATSSFATGSVDNIVLRKTPNCVKPDAPTATPGTSSVSISWDSEASAWNLQYKLASAADWTTVAVGENPYNLSGLAQGTTYKVRVQADCGSGDQSDWSDEASFTTDCDVIAALPFTETFDGALSNCWNITDDNTTTYAHYVYGGELRLPGGEAASGHLVVLPEITASLANATMTIEYTATTGANTATPQVGYIDNESAFQELAPLAKSNTAITERVELAAAGGYRLAIRYDNGTSEGDFNIREIRVSHVEIFEDSESANNNELRLGALNGLTLDVVLTRSIGRNGDYGTISLPFNLSAAQLADDNCPLNGFIIREYNASDVNTAGNIVNIYLKDVNSITAGKAYFIRYDGSESALSPLEFRDVTISQSSPLNVNDGNLRLFGLFNPLAVEANDYGTLFVGSGNMLYYPNVAGYIKGFRAYFTVPTSSPLHAPIRKGAPIRISEQKNTPTGISNIEGGNSTESKKIIENGQFFIIRNGIKYDAQGKKVQ